MPELEASAPLALATLLVGVLAVGVAWRLYRAEVAKQRADLGQERQQHFYLLQAYLVLRAGTQDKAWRVHDELQAVQDHYDSLFNARIGKLVAQALDKGNERDALQQLLATFKADEQAPSRRRLRELDAWFATEAAALSRRCACYLRLAPQTRSAV